MSSTVYLVQHERRVPLPTDVKLIGVYATQADAESAVARVRNQPGFRDLPLGFCITPVVIGRDSWAEGFGATHESGVAMRTVACMFCAEQITPEGDDPLELFIRGAITDTEQGFYAHGACLRAVVHSTVPLLAGLPPDNAAD